MLDLSSLKEFPPVDRAARSSSSERRGLLLCTACIPMQCRVCFKGGGGERAVGRGYTLHYAGKLPSQTHVHYSDLMITFHICRLKAKGSSAKRGRRITLTPLPSQPASSNHFSSTSSPDNCWKTNPAFTNHFTLSEKPTSLSEEKRLLQLERTKRRQKYGSKSASISKYMCNFIPCGTGLKIWS